MAAIDYDAATEDTEEGDSPAEEEAETDPSQDDEFLMAAEEAGFTGEKASALWRAIQRCNELGGMGPMPTADEEM